MMTNEHADHAVGLRKESNGFKLFTALLNDLSATDGTQEKVCLLMEYFNNAPPDCFAQCCSIVRKFKKKHRGIEPAIEPHWAN